MKSWSWFATAAVVIAAAQLTTVGACFSYEYYCDNGYCISSSLECNGNDDCFDNSDEDHCGTTASCYSFQYKCNNGHCIASYKLCDGHNDCSDHSDEYYCNTNAPCYGYRCDNGNCIESSYECDNYDDCSDGSDEDHCQPDVDVGLAVGVSVSFGIMLVVPIICVAVACYYKARNRRRALQTRVVSRASVRPMRHEVIVVTSSNRLQDMSQINPTSSEFQRCGPSSGVWSEPPPAYSSTPDPAELAASDQPPPQYSFENPLPSPPVGGDLSGPPVFQDTAITDHHLPSYDQDTDNPLVNDDREPLLQQ